MQTPERKKEWRKLNYSKNKGLILEKNKIWAIENRERKLAYLREYHALHKQKANAVSNNYYENNKEQSKKKSLRGYYLNKENRLAKMSEYYSINKKTIQPKRTARTLKRLKEEPLFRLQFLLRSNLLRLIEKKNRKTKELFSFTTIELKLHLEKQFTSKMSWKNHGVIWEIDHKIPISWFKTEEQILKWGFRLSNLQPLEKSLNHRKSNKYVLDVEKNPLCETIYLLPAPKEVNLNG